MNNFYFYDGVVRNIPNIKDILRFFFDNLTDLQRDKVVCGRNTLFNEVWWLYPTGTENNRYVKFNYDDKAWDVGTIARTAMIDRDVISNPIMAGTDGFLYRHEDDVNDGTSAMNESIQSAPFQIGDGDRMAQILQIIPDFQNLTGSITISVLTRKYPQGAELEESATAITSSTETIDVRAQGRQASVKIAGSSVDNNWGFGTVRFDVVPGGKR